MFFSIHNSSFRPQKKQVLIFGMIILPFMIAVVYYLRFIWLFQLITFLPVMIIFLLLAGAAIFYIDWKLKFKTVRYFKVSVVIFLVIFFISLPVCRMLEILSEKRAKKIISKIEAYKKGKKEYPDFYEFYGFKELPGRTLLGTRYYYNVDVVKGEEIYTLKFKAFNGNTAYYNPATGNWLYTD